MKEELEYSRIAKSKHIKEYGQFFTNFDVACFMAKWVSQNAKRLLDPAAGNSVFLRYIKKFNAQCSLDAYEIDKKILKFFGNPTNSNIMNEDYLLTGWDEKYDAIICNPPYNRFQAVTNRIQIIDEIEKHTGIKYSSYTNLYILFLLKSIYQMSSNGKLAYIIPTEFLNSKYGTPIKEKLLKEKLLRAIINFKNNQELFFNATTTCCILLLDKEEKREVRFYNLESVSELHSLRLEDEEKCLTVNYETICAERKWREYLNQEVKQKYSNLKQISDFCTVSRGIATGDNGFFCLSKSQIANYRLPRNVVDECVCKSADVKGIIFKREDFLELANANKSVYLLNIKNVNDSATVEYIKEGERKELNKKYLLSCRNPWYSMEQKPIAPIWVSSACRNRLKFVRNIAGVHSLTTFHSIFVNQDHQDDINIIFCYFLTPIAQLIIRENRKELGNGLEKFQPNDLKTAKMLDISVISKHDKKAISKIYDLIVHEYDNSYIESLNKIFERYLCA